MKHKNFGFTLIELMIVIIVLSILTAIAVPAYKDYVRKARRSDAKAGISQAQLAEEKWRANNPSYSAVLADLGLPTDSPDGYYTLSISSADATTYTIQAVPKSPGPQEDDYDCDLFEIDQNGVQYAEDDGGGDTTTDCW
ncbi:MAG: type IV pilin protein [Gammaproteobacteria bacterium]